MSKSIALFAVILCCMPETAYAQKRKTGKLQLEDDIIYNREKFIENHVDSYFIFSMKAMPGSFTVIPNEFNNMFCIDNDHKANILKIQGNEFKFDTLLYEVTKKNHYRYKYITKKDIIIEDVSIGIRNGKIEKTNSSSKKHTISSGGYFEIVPSRSAGLAFSKNNPRVRIASGATNYYAMKYMNCHDTLFSAASFYVHADYNVIYKGIQLQNHFIFIDYQDETSDSAKTLIKIFDTMGQMQEMSFSGMCEFHANKGSRSFLIGKTPGEYLQFKLKSNGLFEKNDVVISKGYSIHAYAEKNDTLFMLLKKNVPASVQNLDNAIDFKLMVKTNTLMYEKVLNPGKKFVFQPDNLKINENGSLSLFYNRHVFITFQFFHGSKKIRFQKQTATFDYLNKNVTLMMNLPSEVFFATGKKPKHITYKILMNQQSYFDKNVRLNSGSTEDTNCINILPCVISGAFTNRINLFITYGKRNVSQSSQGNLLATYDYHIRCGEYAFMYNSKTRTIYTESEHKETVIKGGLKEALDYAANYFVGNSQYIN